MYIYIKSCEMTNYEYVTRKVDAFEFYIFSYLLMIIWGKTHYLYIFPIKIPLKN